MNSIKRKTYSDFLKLTTSSLSEPDDLLSSKSINFDDVLLDSAFLSALIISNKLFDFFNESLRGVLLSSRFFCLSILLPNDDDDDEDEDSSSPMSLFDVLLDVLNLFKSIKLLFVVSKLCDFLNDSVKSDLKKQEKIKACYSGE
jgi:hypothetical protein